MEEPSNTCDIFATWKVSPDLYGLTEALRPLQAGGVNAPGTWVPPPTVHFRDTPAETSAVGRSRDRGWIVRTREHGRHCCEASA
ncbi:hypothetical protein NDU88_001883 [Pleurodeles waltl]|uniref:Uncharacterized protein n=1 Tax=Pleurodeles waltl TaxID=8319 RepID=A0AAV7VD69_PLEWA|nr:hypothetical protein NDU88_001883 [Pleurodeles waltl]